MKENNENLDLEPWEIKMLEEIEAESRRIDFLAPLKFIIGLALPFLIFMLVMGFIVSLFEKSTPLNSDSSCHEECLSTPPFTCYEICD